ncbi:MAG: HNH endonuclease [Rubrivivax sp.]|nr:HNH endonuclease [Rubrivivax sp.]
MALSAAAAPGDRSRALRAEFQRTNPCPSTGARRGACPGYEVDHREALICGGRDELANLQWLTVEEQRAKTRVEVKLCRSR